MSEIKFRGVYGYFMQGKLIYVGSSACKLTTLEYNHRNWNSQYGEEGRTNFRTHITENVDYMDGEFRWLLMPAKRTQEDVESLEGQLIRSLKPKLNIDKDPVASSRKYGRY